MRTTSRLPLAVAAVAFAVPLATACSASVDLGADADTSELTTAITKELNRAYAAIGRTVSSVDCPDTIERETGSTVRCTVDVDGTAINVDVVAGDRDGDVRIQTVEKLYDMTHAAKSLATQVSAKIGVAVTVDCGTGLKALPPGGTFDCRVTNPDGDVRGLRLTAGTPTGEDRWRLE